LHINDAVFILIRSIKVTCISIRLFTYRAFHNVLRDYKHL